MEKRPSGFEFARWELLLENSAQSEATSLTRVELARVGVSRILAMLDMSESSRDPAVAALATESDMLFRYESRRFSVSSGMVWGSWKVTLWSLLVVVVALAVPELWLPASPAARRWFLWDSWAAR